MLSTPCLLEKLVALRPVTADVTQVNAAVAAVRDYLAAEGLHVREETVEGRRVLYASNCGEAAVDVLLNAHLDVVPADEATFQCREDDGWLYGRGTYDCLGNCAMIANLLVQLKQQRPLGALFSTDEETGGSTTAYMAGRCPDVRKLVLVIDGDGDALAIAQKGVLALKLVAAGTACHAAEPWDGVNAIDKLLDGYSRIRHLFPQVTADDPWHNTMAATLCQAGTAHNRVPDLAEMTLNIRYTKPGTMMKFVDRIRAGSGLDVTVVMHSEPVAFDESTPALRLLAEHMRNSFGHNITITRLNGATDARHFAGRGVPVAIIGVVGRGLHGADECVELVSLAANEAMLFSFLQRGSLLDQL